MLKHSQLQHNLNISMYSFQEILNLFDIDSYNISTEDIKRAKKKVLMLHPDKSKLPSEYFLFYKKALDIVYNYYQETNKQNQEVNPQQMVYNTKLLNTSFSKATQSMLKETITNIPGEKFNQTFNELFEKNMAKQRDESKYQWFKNDDEDPIYKTDGPINKSNMNQAFEQIKQQQQGLIKYQGVQDFVVRGNTSNCYLDNDDDDEDNTYISSDPFNKLKFDDLRKVHKDQTVFAVSEREYDAMAKYNNVEQYSRARGAQTLTPLETQHAQKILMEQENLRKQQMAQRQHKAFNQTKEYEQKNNSVLAAFLQLKN